MTMLIWRLWWLWQEKNYEKEVVKATGFGKGEKEGVNVGKVADDDEPVWPDRGGVMIDIDQSSIREDVREDVFIARQQMNRIGRDIVIDVDPGLVGPGPVNRQLSIPERRELNNRRSGGRWEGYN